MSPKFDTKRINEVVTAIWMPMFRKLLKNGHKCPCFPEEGLCPCPDFLQKLECKCGMFILKEVFVKKGGKIERVIVNG